MEGNTNIPAWVTLTPNERIVWSGRPSLRSAVWSLAGGLISIGVGLGGFVVFSSEGASPLLMGLSLIPLVVGLLHIGLLLLHRRSVHYILTTDAVYKRTGLLTRTVSNLRRDRIQHTSYTQTLRERLLTYGTIRIDTAGSDGSEITLVHIPDPMHVIELLTKPYDSVRSQPPTI